MHTNIRSIQVFYLFLGLSNKKMIIFYVLSVISFENIKKHHLIILVY